MAKLKVAVAGASERMGRTLIDAVLRDPELGLAAALEIKGNAHLGKNAGELGGFSVRRENHR